MNNKVMDLVVIDTLAVTALGLVYADVWFWINHQWVSGFFGVVLVLVALLYIYDAIHKRIIS